METDRGTINLASFEDGFSFFIEGQNAFVSILGGDHAVIGLNFKVKPSLQVDLQAVVNGFFCLTH